MTEQPMKIRHPTCEQRCSVKPGCEAK